MEIERTINGVDYVIDVHIESHDEFWVETIQRVDDEGHLSIDVDPTSAEGKAVEDALDWGDLVSDWLAHKADAAKDMYDDRDR